MEQASTYVIIPNRLEEGYKASIHEILTAASNGDIKSAREEMGSIRARPNSTFLRTDGADIYAAPAYTVLKLRLSFSDADKIKLNKAGATISAEKPARYTEAFRKFDFRTMEFE